ncbi:hypothetical protein LTT66_18095 [Nocardia gipuzkoensis]|uniref:hypothetical protein n=1 Tax=Nocardia gipuzkoensis TaxID=2749991 RepID=UPI001E3994C9|nr:hypothetical protein [Nocardia gipuzkoensis]UGT65281.1 hypothetical protein LTT66_18095 [Nocardia gipuzkoensis]
MTERRYADFDVIADADGVMHAMDNGIGQCIRHGMEADCLSRLMLFGWADPGIRINHRNGRA